MTVAMNGSAAHQQHWDEVLCPGKLASTAGYHLQVDEEDHLQAKHHFEERLKAGLETELSPFEQQQQHGDDGQQQHGDEAASLQVEANHTSTDLEPFAIKHEADETGVSLAALPRSAILLQQCTTLAAATTAVALHGAALHHVRHCELSTSYNCAWLIPFCRVLWSSGTCCMLCAAFIFSLSALFVKLTAGRVPVLQITLIRSGLSFLVSTGETARAAVCCHDAIASGLHWTIAVDWQKQ
jgi:hypothetical protein